jgi:DNA-binding transcriptional LysR family regulator
MPDLALDLRHLKYAVLVAEHGSFRRAAAASNIPQSTISRRIQMLEARLGAALFERSKTGTKLTRAGEHFIRNAAVGAHHLQQVVSGLASMKSGYSGQLLVGVTASLAQGPLANLLALYRVRFPGVRVAVEEAASENNAAAVASGRLDVAFVLGTQCAPGCERKNFYNEGLFAAVPVGHPFAAGSGVCWDDLRDETFLIAADGTGPEVEGIVLRRLSEIGFRPHLSIQKVGRENLLNLVGKGFGLTVVAGSTLGATYPGVQFLPFCQETESLSWSATWSSANANSALVRLRS